MRYATILFAALLSSCGQAKTASKNTTPAAMPMAASLSAEPSTIGDTVQEHIDKGDGLIVDVLQAGTGRAVEMGDTVTLEYTISYVPTAASKADAKPGKDAKESKSAPKHDAKKPVKKHADAKTDETAPAGADESKAGESADAAKKEAAGKHAESKGADAKSADKKHTEKTDTEKKDTEKKDTDKKDAEKKDTEKKDAAKRDTEDKATSDKDAAKPATTKKDADEPDKAKSEADKKDGEKPDDAKKDDAKKDGEKKDAAKSGDDAKPGDKGGEHDATTPASSEGAAHDAKPAQDPANPAEKPAEKPAEAQKPVVVASSKSLLSPFTVKLSNDAKPKLMPGLVRGLEGLKVGTRARITVPAALAYGKDGDTSSGIPPETPVQIDVVVKEARE